jgi:pyruvate carboxylase
MFLTPCSLHILQAEIAVLGSVGAPMAGSVIEVTVKTGQAVHAGQQLVVMSAMKMETAVCAPVAGVVTQVACDQGDNLEAGDLVVYIDTSVPVALNSTDVDPLGSQLDVQLSPEAKAEILAAAAGEGQALGGSSSSNGGNGAAVQQQQQTAGSAA